MKMRRFAVLILTMGLLVPMLATATPAPAPLAAACAPGASYDPACDVDHDGDVDILDIQLAAGHWSQSGAWTGGDGWSLTGNAGTTAGTNFLGTTDSQAFEIKVNGQRALRIAPTTFSPNLIGGYFGNQVSAGMVGATIGGGGAAGNINQVTDWYGAVGGGEYNTAGNNAGLVTDAAGATVGGGYGNTAGASYATVGGGYQNEVAASYGTIAGGGPGSPGNYATRNRVTDNYGSIGGGGDNQAGDAAGPSTDQAYATVSGGLSNTASGYGAAIGGGTDNTATGYVATVAGGLYNNAVGDYSFAAGQNANANHQGSFVWNDASFVSASSSTLNEFTVSSSNGMRIIAANNIHYGVYARNYGAGPAVYADTDGVNAGYFSDNIYVGGACTGCELAYVVRNSGEVALEVGDVVAPAGVESPLAGTTDAVLRVRQADSQGAAVIGVVQGRAVLSRSEKGGQIVEEAMTAEGAIQPGDYLFIIVQGLAQVKVQAGEAIIPGQRLTSAAAAAPGRARSLLTKTIDGMMVAEGAPVIGIALATPDAATGLVMVMVTLH